MNWRISRNFGVCRSARVPMKDPAAVSEGQYLQPHSRPKTESHTTWSLLLVQHYLSLYAEVFDFYFQDIIGTNVKPLLVCVQMLPCLHHIRPSVRLIIPRQQGLSPPVRFVCRMGNELVKAAGASPT